jgi:hypothetical protein
MEFKDGYKKGWGKQLLLSGMIIRRMVKSAPNYPGRCKILLSNKMGKPGRSFLDLDKFPHWVILIDD